MIDKDVEKFAKGIYEIWFGYSGSVEEKINLCVKLFNKIVHPETIEQYYISLDDYEEAMEVLK